MLRTLFTIALRNLFTRRKRSFLTIIGIFIGITAVVALISLGKGMEEAILGQFERMGSDVITVIALSGGAATPMASLISPTPLTDKDAKLIESINGVERVSRWALMPDAVFIDGERVDTFVTGVDPENIDLLIGETKWKIIAGRNLEKGDKYRAIMGYDFYSGFGVPKLEIYDKIRGHEFRVVGFIAKVGNRQDDRSIIIPLDTMREMYGMEDRISLIYIKVMDGYDVDEGAERIREELRDKRNEKEGHETFQVSTAKELLEIVGRVLAIVQAVLVGIAAISLLVGGVGIMNTMYTSTLERTKDIGIMKAVGARKRDILLIFLFESGLLGLLGGVIGVIAGLFLAKVVEIGAAAYYGFELIKASYNPFLIGGALLFSFFVGAVAGFIPAKNAAELDPVEALRYE